MISTNIVSSNIQAVGWHRGTLFIKFNSGDSYSYKNVDIKTYHELAQSDSVGQYFHRFVRSRFDFTKMTNDPFNGHKNVMNGNAYAKQDSLVDYNVRAIPSHTRTNNL